MGQNGACEVCPIQKNTVESQSARHGVRIFFISITWDQACCEVNTARWFNEYYK
jgi:hypothetical protein